MLVFHVPEALESLTWLSHVNGTYSLKSSLTQGFLSALYSDFNMCNICMCTHTSAHIHLYRCICIRINKKCSKISFWTLWKTRHDPSTGMGEGIWASSPNQEAICNQYLPTKDESVFSSEISLGVLTTPQGRLRAQQ